MDLTNMEMNQIDFRQATIVEDTEEGTDYLINDWRFAHRQRNISLDKYRQVSIRYSTALGNDTEYHKILDGRCKAQIYLFEFTDALVVCAIGDIKDCLKQGKYEVVPNPDGSSGAYIVLSNLNRYFTV